MQQTAAVPVVSIPHDVHDTFVRALGTSTLGDALFSSAEKRLLLLLCAGVFTLPILTSVLLVKTTAKPVTLATPSTTHAMLEQPTNVSPGGSDELAMAKYFMEKAQSASGPEAAHLLSQAQALLDTTTQTGQKVIDLKSELQAYLHTAPDMVNTSPQRVAAPAPGQVAGALSATTQSNATGSQAIMKAGTTSLVVTAPGISDESQIYLTLPENSDNAVIYVKQKQAGSNFTLASLSPLPHDVTVTWYQIETP